MGECSRAQRGAQTSGPSQLEESTKATTRYEVVALGWAGLGWDGSPFPTAVVGVCIEVYHLCVSCAGVYACVLVCVEGARGFVWLFMCVCA